MMFGKKLMRCITLAVLAAFTYSSVLAQPLHAAMALAQEYDAARGLRDRLEGFVLPYRLGRVMAGAYSGDERLVVYVQDLHCHPEVQKNIAEIIRLFDNRYGVNRILIEGAPCGKVDTGLLSAIPGDDVRKRVLENLLGKGLLGGAEYYAVLADRDTLYGLEQWDLYEKNLHRIRRLIGEKDRNLAVAERLETRLGELKGRYLSDRLRRLEKRLEPAEETKRVSPKRYVQLEKLAGRAGEDLSSFPNLWRYVRMLRLNREIRFKRLPKELASYVMELRKVVPYGVYQVLLEKLERGNKEEEYYLGLARVAGEYSPGLAAKYPEVSRFLEYVRLNYAVNPIHLVSEERILVDRVLRRSAGSLMERELLLLSRMSSIFKSVVELKITPEEYDYFREHAESFRVLAQKYVPAAELADVLRLLDDGELRAFYETNISRNDVFLRAVMNPDGKSGTADCAPTGNAPEDCVDVLRRIDSFKEIDIVVTGGFHSVLTGMLRERGVSYLALTPNVTKDYNETVYEKLLTGNIRARDLLSSAFAPEAFCGRITPEHVRILSLAISDEAARTGLRPELVAETVRKWLNDEVGFPGASVKTLGSIVRVEAGGAVAEFVVEGNRVRLPDGAEAADDADDVRGREPSAVSRALDWGKKFVAVAGAGISRIAGSVQVTRAEVVTVKPPAAGAPAASGETDTGSRSESQERVDRSQVQGASPFPYGSETQIIDAALDAKLQIFREFSRCHGETQISDSSNLTGSLLLSRLDVNESKEGAVVLSVHRAVPDALAGKPAQERELLLALLPGYAIDQYMAVNEPESAIGEEFTRHLRGQNLHPYRAKNRNERAFTAYVADLSKASGQDRPDTVLQRDLAGYSRLIRFFESIPPEVRLPRFSERTVTGLLRGFYPDSGFSPATVSGITRSINTGEVTISEVSGRLMDRRASGTLPASDREFEEMVADIRYDREIRDIHRSILRTRAGRRSGFNLPKAVPQDLHGELVRMMRGGQLDRPGVEALLWRIERGELPIAQALSGEGIAFAGGGLIGKYRLLSSPVFDHERDVVRFRGRQIETGAEEDIEIPAQVMSRSDVLARLYQFDRLETGEELVSRLLDTESSEGFRGEFLLLEPNGWGIQGIGTRDLIAVQRGFRDDPMAWFHETAHAMNDAGNLPQETILAGLSPESRAWYEGMITAPSRRELSVHYAIRALQRDADPLLDEFLSYRIQGRMTPEDVRKHIRSKTERPRNLAGLRQRFREFRKLCVTREEEAGMLDLLIEESLMEEAREAVARAEREQEAARLREEEERQRNQVVEVFMKAKAAYEDPAATERKKEERALAALAGLRKLSSARIIDLLRSLLVYSLTDDGFNTFLFSKGVHEALDPEALAGLAEELFSSMFLRERPHELKNISLQRFKLFIRSTRDRQVLEQVSGAYLKTLKERKSGAPFVERWELPSSLDASAYFHPDPADRDIFYFKRGFLGAIKSGIRDLKTKQRLYGLFKEKHFERDALKAAGIALAGSALHGGFTASLVAELGNLAGNAHSRLLALSVLAAGWDEKNPPDPEHLSLFLRNAIDFCRATFHDDFRRDVLLEIKKVSAFNEDAELLAFARSEIMAAARKATRLEKMAFAAGQTLREAKETKAPRERIERAESNYRSILDEYTEYMQDAETLLDILGRNAWRKLDDRDGALAADIMGYFAELADGLSGNPDIAAEASFYLAGSAELRYGPAIRYMARASGVERRVLEKLLGPGASDRSIVRALRGGVLGERAGYLVLRTHTKRRYLLRDIVMDPALDIRLRLYAFQTYAVRFLSWTDGMGKKAYDERTFASMTAALTGEDLDRFIRDMMDPGATDRLFDDPLLQHEELKAYAAAVLLALQNRFAELSRGRFPIVSARGMAAMAQEALNPMVIRNYWENASSGGEMGGSRFNPGQWRRSFLRVLAHELMHAILEHEYGYSAAGLRARIVHEMLADLAGEVVGKEYGSDRHDYRDLLRYEKHFTEVLQDDHYSIEEHEGGRAQLRIIEDAVEDLRRDMQEPSVEPVKLLLAALSIIRNVRFMDAAEATAFMLRRYRELLNEDMPPASGELMDEMFFLSMNRKGFDDTPGVRLTEREARQRLLPLEEVKSILLNGSSATLALRTVRMAFDLELLGTKITKLEAPGPGSVFDPLLRKAFGRSSAAYRFLTVAAAPLWETYGLFAGMSLFGFWWTLAGFAAAHIAVRWLTRAFAGGAFGWKNLWRNNRYYLWTDARDFFAYTGLASVFLSPYGLGLELGAALSAGLHALYNGLALDAMLPAWLPVASVFQRVPGKPDPELNGGRDDVKAVLDAIGGHAARDAKKEQADRLVPRLDSLDERTLSHEIGYYAFDCARIDDDIDDTERYHAFVNLLTFCQSLNARRPGAVSAALGHLYADYILSASLHPDEKNRIVEHLVKFMLEGLGNEQRREFARMLLLHINAQGDGRASIDMSEIARIPWLPKSPVLLRLFDQDISDPRKFFFKEDYLERLDDQSLRGYREQLLGLYSPFAGRAMVKRSIGYLLKVDGDLFGYVFAALGSGGWNGYAFASVVLAAADNWREGLPAGEELFSRCAAGIINAYRAVRDPWLRRQLLQRLAGLRKFNVSSDGQRYVVDFLVVQLNDLNGRAVRVRAALEVAERSAAALPAARGQEGADRRVRLLRRELESILGDAENMMAMLASAARTATDRVLAGKIVAALCRMVRTATADRDIAAEGDSVMASFAEEGAAVALEYFVQARGAGAEQAAREVLARGADGAVILRFLAGSADERLRYLVMRRHHGRKDLLEDIILRNPRIDIRYKLYAFTLYASRFLQRTGARGNEEYDTEMFGSMFKALVGGDNGTRLKNLMSGLISDRKRFQALFSDRVLQDEEAKVYVMGSLLAMQHHIDFVTRSRFRLISARGCARIAQAVRNTVVRDHFGNALAGSRKVVLGGRALGEMRPEFFFPVIGHELGHVILTEDYHYATGRPENSIVHEFFADLCAVTLGRWLGIRVHDFLEKLGVDILHASEPGDDASLLAAHRSARDLFSSMLRAFRAAGIGVHPEWLLVSVQLVVRRFVTTFRVSDVVARALHIYFGGLSVDEERVVDAAKGSPLPGMADILRMIRANVVMAGVSPDAPRIDPGYALDPRKIVPLQAAGAALAIGFVAGTASWLGAEPDLVRLLSLSGTFMSGVWILSLTGWIVRALGMRAGPEIGSDGMRLNSLLRLGEPAEVPFLEARGSTLRINPSVYALLASGPVWLQNVILYASGAGGHEAYHLLNPEESGIIAEIKAYSLTQVLPSLAGSLLAGGFALTLGLSGGWVIAAGIAGMAAAVAGTGAWLMRKPLIHALSEGMEAELRSAVRENPEAANRLGISADTPVIVTTDRQAGITADYGGIVVRDGKIVCYLTESFIKASRALSPPLLRLFARYELEKAAYLRVNPGRASQQFFDQLDEPERKEFGVLHELTDERIATAVRISRQLSRFRNGVAQVFFPVAEEYRRDANEQVLEVIRRVAARGSRDVEIYLDDVTLHPDMSNFGAFLADPSQVTGRDAIRALARELGVELVIHAPWLSFMDGGSARYPDPARDGERFSQALAFARETGARLMTVHATNPGAAAGIAGFVREAARSGITVCLENAFYNDTGKIYAAAFPFFEDSKFLTLREFGDIVEQVAAELSARDRAFLAVTLDAAHANIAARDTRSGGRPDLAPSGFIDMLDGFFDRMRRAGVPVRNIHINQNNGDRDAHQPVYVPGSIDQQGLLRLLRKHRFAGIVNQEVNGPVVFPRKTRRARAEPDFASRRQFLKAAAGAAAAIAAAGFVPATEAMTDGLRDAVRRQGLILEGGYDPGKPTLFFVHGAGGNRDHFKQLIERYRGDHNIVVFSYADQGALDSNALLFRGELNSFISRYDPGRFGIITHSYGGTVLRRAVLDDDTGMFRQATAVELSPILGGSRYAGGASFLIPQLFIRAFTGSAGISAAADPYGEIQRDLYSEESVRRYNERLASGHVITVRGDHHSPGEESPEIFKEHFRCGLGPNGVVLEPRFPGKGRRSRHMELLDTRTRPDVAERIDGISATLSRRTGSDEREDGQAVPVAAGFIGKYRLDDDPVAERSGDGKVTIRFTGTHIESGKSREITLTGRSLSRDEVLRKLEGLYLGGDIVAGQVISWFAGAFEGEVVLLNRHRDIKGIGAKGLVGVSAEFEDQPLAFFHEIVHAMADAGELSLREILDSLVDRSWYLAHVSKPGREDLELHYAIRALQRQLFSLDDAAFTYAIKGRMSPAAVTEAVGKADIEGKGRVLREFASRRGEAANEALEKLLLSRLIQTRKSVEVRIRDRLQARRPGEELRDDYEQAGGILETAEELYQLEGGLSRRCRTTLKGLGKLQAPAAAAAIAARLEREAASGDIGEFSRFLLTEDGGVRLLDERLAAFAAIEVYRLAMQAENWFLDERYKLRAMLVSLAGRGDRSVLEALADELVTGFGRHFRNNLSIPVGQAASVTDINRYFDVNPEDRSAYYFKDEFAVLAGREQEPGVRRLLLRLYHQARFERSVLESGCGVLMRADEDGKLAEIFLSALERGREGPEVRRALLRELSMYWDASAPGQGDRLGRFVRAALEIRSGSYNAGAREDIVSILLRLPGFGDVPDLYRDIAQLAMKEIPAVASEVAAFGSRIEDARSRLESSALPAQETKRLRDHMVALTYHYGQRMEKMEARMELLARVAAQSLERDDPSFARLWDDAVSYLAELAENTGRTASIREEAAACLRRGLLSGDKPVARAAEYFARELEPDAGRRDGYLNLLSREPSVGETIRSLRDVGLGEQQAWLLISRCRRHGDVLRAVAEDASLDRKLRLYAFHLYAAGFLAEERRDGETAYDEKSFQALSAALLPEAMALLETSVSDDALVRRLFAAPLPQDDEAKVYLTAVLLSLHGRLHILTAKGCSRIAGIIDGARVRGYRDGADDALNFGGKLFSENRSPANLLFQIMVHELGHTILTNEFDVVRLRGRDELKYGIVHERVADGFVGVFSEMFGLDQGNYREAMLYAEGLQRVVSDEYTARFIHDGARAQELVFKETLARQGVGFHPEAFLRSLLMALGATTVEDRSLRQIFLSAMGIYFEKGGLSLHDASDPVSLLERRGFYEMTEQELRIRQRILSPYEILWHFFRSSRPDDPLRIGERAADIVRALWLIGPGSFGKDGPRETGTRNGGNTIVSNAAAERPVADGVLEEFDEAVAQRISEDNTRVVGKSISLGLLLGFPKEDVEWFRKNRIDDVFSDNRLQYPRGQQWVEPGSRTPQFLARSRQAQELLGAWGKAVVYAQAVVREGRTADPAAPGVQVEPGRARFFADLVEELRNARDDEALGYMLSAEDPTLMVFLLGVRKPAYYAFNYDKAIVQRIVDTQAFGASDIRVIRADFQFGNDLLFYRPADVARLIDGDPAVGEVLGPRIAELAGKAASVTVAGEDAAAGTVAALKETARAVTLAVSPAGLSARGAVRIAGTGGARDQRQDAVREKTRLLVVAGSPSRRVETAGMLFAEGLPSGNVILGPYAGEAGYGELRRGERLPNVIDVPFPVQGRTAHMAVELYYRDLVSEDSTHRALDVAARPVPGMDYHDPAVRETARTVLARLDAAGERMAAETADFLARVALAIAAEKNEGGKFAGAFAEHGVGGEAWLLEAERGEAMEPAFNRVLLEAGARRRADTVYGWWEGRSRPKEHFDVLIDGSVNNGELRRELERLREEGRPSGDRTRAVVKLMTVLAAGTLGGVKQLARVLRNGEAGRIVIGLSVPRDGSASGLGFDLQAIDWVAFIDEVVESGALERLEEREREFVRSTRAWLADLNSESRQIVSKDELEAREERTYQLARTLLGSGYGKTLEQRLGGETSPRAGMLAGQRAARLQRDRALPDEVFIQMVGICQLGELAAELRAEGVSVSVALGAAAASDLDEAVFWLETTGGVEIDLSGKSAGEIESMLGDVRIRMERSISRSRMRADADVRVKIGDALQEGLVRKHGFHPVRDASGIENLGGSDQKRIVRELGGQGASVELDAMAGGAQDLIRTAISSGVEEVTVRLGAVTEGGAVVRVPLAVSTESGFGLMTLVTLLGGVLPLTRVMTPGGRFRVGLERGERAAARLGADAPGKLLASSADGASIFRTVERIIRDAVAGGRYAELPAAVRLLESTGLDALTAAARIVLDDFARSDESDRKAFASELLGVVLGAARELALRRAGAAESPRTAVRREALGNLLIEMMRLVTFEGGRARLAPGTKLEDAVRVLPGVLVLLSTEERAGLVQDVIGQVKASPARRALTPELAESLYRGLPAGAWEGVRAFFAEELKSYRTADLTRMPVGELVRWNNMMTVLSQRGVREARGEMRRGWEALEERRGELMTEEKVLILSLALGELRKVGELRGVTAGVSDVQAEAGGAYAAQNYWRQSDAGAAEVEQRIEGYIDVTVYRGMDTGEMLNRQPEPKTADEVMPAALSARWLLDRIALEEREIFNADNVNQGMNAGSLEAVRLVLTAG